MHHPTSHIPMPLPPRNSAQVGESRRMQASKGQDRNPEATYNFATKKTFRLRLQTNRAAIISAWRPSIQTSHNATEDSTEKHTITNAEQTSRCHTARRNKHTYLLFKFGLCEDCKATPRKDIKISTPQDEYANVKGLFGICFVHFAFLSRTVFAISRCTLCCDVRFRLMCVQRLGVKLKPTFCLCC